MDSRYPRCLRFLVLLVSVIGVINGQVPSARSILENPEANQVRFVRETMDAGFLGDRADQMTMLVINRSALVLPLLEERVEAELRSPSPSKSLIETATEMIAYAGDEVALREISKLVAIDGGRFGPLVGRTLGNALNFRNPFTVAYRGVDTLDEAIAQRIAAWADSALSSPRMQRLWAGALVERYRKVPSESEWAGDPLASRLPLKGVRVRSGVLSFAAEAHEKQERQLR